jgi:hypothetical protein
VNSRIRTVKPEMAKHYALWRIGRLLDMPMQHYYTMLFCYTDRRGRFVWDPLRLGVEIAPWDHIEFAHVLNALANTGHVIKYRVGARLYGWIPRFTTHQIFNGRESDSALPPAPPEAERWADMLAADPVMRTLDGFTADVLIDEPVCIEAGVVARRAEKAPSGSALGDNNLETREPHDADTSAHVPHVGSVLFRSDPFPETEGTEIVIRRSHGPDAVVTLPPGQHLVSDATPAAPLPAIRGPRDSAAVRDRLAEVFQQMGAGTRRTVTREQERKLQAEMVFLYWTARFAHAQAILDHKREARIMARLAENGGDVSELLYALDGAFHDDFIMGRNEHASKKAHDGIETLLRDRGQIERFAQTRKGYRDSQPHRLLAKLAAAVRDPGADGEGPVITVDDPTLSHGEDAHGPPTASQD